MIRFALLVLALWHPLAPAPVHAAPQAAPRQAGAEDAVARLARWLKRYGDGREDVPAEARRDLEALVAELRMLQAAVPARRHDVFLALLDLAALAPRRAAGLRDSRWTQGTGREEAAEFGYDALERAFEVDRQDDLPAWVALAVLGQPPGQAVARRCAALEILRGRHLEATQLAIIANARDPDRRVREAALEALFGWPSDAVHRFMLTQFARLKAECDWGALAPIQRHFEAVRLEPGSEVERALYDAVREDLVSPDWRTATRALRLFGCVGDELAMPALIETLGAWIGRREHNGKGSRRIEDEVHRQLKARSGAGIGPSPERWALWWRARGSGAAPPGEAEAPQPVTRAGFFGLRPVTDKVTFVIDRSLSMEGAFGSAGASRYREAARQMAAFLNDLGPQTRFRVVLFESAIHVWKDQLQPATPANVATAEAWVGYQHPGGGTVLRTPIEHVLRLRPDGTLDLRKLEEDTVIVLCDGDTTDGPSWVAPLLERVGAEACVVFHCVRIGSGGDGTLEALARLTGGEYLQCDG